MGNLTYSVLASELRGSDALTQLALDLHWSWNHATVEIWKELDPELWDLTENPWLILKSVSQEKLDSLHDSGRSRLEQLLGSNLRATHNLARNIAKAIKQPRWDVV
jgi:starch phosphorylase